MAPPRSAVDWDSYLAYRVTVKNDDGGRGYDRGIRVFDCGLCSDRYGRGWLHVGSGVYGCFNSGCEAEPRLPGGAVAWVQAVEGFPSLRDTWAYLLDNFRSEGLPAPPASPPEPIRDWCRLPPSMETDWERILARPYKLFIGAQWGVHNPPGWDLGYCRSMPYRGRVIIPIRMGGHLVAFQARGIRPTLQPKYLTSAYGDEDDPKAECGRSAASLLFNLDRVNNGGEVLLVEGPGDAMAWHTYPLRSNELVAVALLGVHLTADKLALLAAKRVHRVIVALDNQPDAQIRARAHVADLQAWGMPAVLGRWEGGKDAGTGAHLVIQENSGSLSSRLAARFFSPRRS